MKKNNSVLLVLLTCILLSFTVTCLATSEENTGPVFEWNISESATDSVIAKLYPHSESEDKFELIITGEGSMRSFSDSSPAQWFQYADSISSVTIEKGVENLSKGAIDGCIYLAELRIENPKLILSANGIPYTTKIYGHGSSTAQNFVLYNYPDRFFLNCKFENSVCNTCSYKCESHSGGAAGCNEFPKCEICGAEYGNKKEHNLSQLVSTRSATCTTDGMLAHYFCTLCNGFFDESQEPTTKESLLISASHNFGELCEYVAPTCTEAGFYAHYHCDVCDENFDESKNLLPTVLISALGHSGGLATCTQSAICDACKQPYGDINAENHIYSEILKYDTERHWLECECMHKKDISSHALAENTIKQATESEEGIIELSCICGYSTERSVPMLQKPAVPEKTDTKNNAAPNNIRLWVILTACGAAVVAATVGTAVIILIKKGKK